MLVEARARNAIHRFPCEPGEKVLHAGLRHGFRLPYECGTGTCGTCRARLVEGRVDDGWPDAPGRSFLKRGGEFLMCQSAALDDCVLEIAVAVPMMTPEWPRPHRLAAVINHAAWLTDDVLFIRCEPERPIEFEAGQFVIVEVPGIAGGRAYSMVNFARPARHLDFVIKKKPAGCLSEWLFDRASGARLTGAPASGATDAPLSARGSPLTPLTAAPVSLFGPLGQATFTPDLDGDVLCVAGGSGIAGMMSILVRAGQARHFERFGAHLFFGVRRARDLFFLDELAAFKREWGAALHLTIALSDEVVPPDLVTERRHDFAFDTGLVHDVAGRHMKGRFSTVRAWVAGPPPMVDATLRMLLKEGRLAPARIRYDKFS